MRALNNIKITNKVALVLSTLICVSGATSVIGYQSLAKQEQTAVMTEHTYKVVGTLDSLMAAMVDQETGMRGYLVSADEAFLAPQKKGADTFAKELATVRELTSDNPAQQARLNDLEASARSWTQRIVEAEIPMMKDPSTRDKARAYEASGAGKQAMDAIRAKVQEMKDVERKLLDARSVEAEAAASTAKLISIGGGLLVILFGLAAVAIINGTVARPVRQIRDAMLRLAQGDRSSKIPHAERTDEVGEMAGAVEVFRHAAIQNHRLEEEAEAARSQAEQDRARLTAEAEAAAQKRLNEATAGLAAGLRRLAQGDLSFQLDQAFAPDFEPLRHDLNGAVAELGKTLSAVSGATISIDNGSNEISRGANDLSRRTEQQAASLEETAAALDQITANVSNSSQRVNEARAVAIEANRSAAHSGGVVSSAVEAMERIETSSQQIANIIGVIDEIAFQTNLLALNAGVEAARAGEAGKGFAVVAQEVRELAQRSATAAKEIKDLIRASTEQVGGGVRLVRETGDALHTIERHIVTMNQHMEAIATSSKEQSVALAEVNTAINQMDQVTQQNAAMVEQTSAASTTLATESAKLKSMIEQFALPQDRSPLHATAATMRSVAPALAPRPKMVANGGSGRQEGWSEF
jgi:methyl-accepting chemotaxis protein